MDSQCQRSTKDACSEDESNKPRSRDLMVPLKVGHLQIFVHVPGVLVVEYSILKVPVLLFER